MILLKILVCVGIVVDAIYGHPLEARTKNEEVKLNGRSSELPSHMLNMEHREIGTKKDSINDVVKKVLSSRTASAMDEVVSSMVTLAGGVVEDLGNLMVETIDQLPDTIRVVSDVVGKAVDLKREKVLIIVKGVKMEDEVQDVRGATKRLASAVDNSKWRSSLTKLEEAFASLVGKFIGVTYKNADNINSAFNDGIKRLTGDNNETETETAKIKNASIVKLIEEDSKNQIKDS